MNFDILTWAFLSAFLIQLLYIVFIFGKFLLYKPGATTGSDERRVSVVVAAHNEYENLKNLIPSLLRQHYENYEVILVDDRSSDPTTGWIKETYSDHKRLRYLRIDSTPEGIHPKKFALETGIQSARFEYILLTDADCLPLSDAWIGEMQTGFEEEKEIVLGYSGYRKEAGLLNLFVRFETIFTALQYFSWALLKKPYMGVGRNLAYKKSLFLGFGIHRNVTGGDDDLFVNGKASAKNTSIVLSKQSQTVSDPKKTFKSWFRQKKRHLSVGKHYKKSDKIRLGIYYFSFLIFYGTFIAINFTSGPNITVIGLFLVRALLFGGIMYGTGKKLKDRLEFLTIPILDFLYFWYYVIVGIAAVTSKKIRWS